MIPAMNLMATMATITPITIHSICKTHSGIAILQTLVRNIHAIAKTATMMMARIAIYSRVIMFLRVRVSGGVNYYHPLPSPLVSS